MSEMKKRLLAVTVGAVIALPGIVSAAQVDDKGIKITSDDGKFEAEIAGRIHFDGYAFDSDEVDSTTTTEFRRARLTLAGKLYDWEYKFENDFAGQSGTTGSGLRDMFVATKVGAGKLIIGQFKPFRSMEELTSSNEILMMERPFSSATGLYSGRQFRQGLGYLMGGANYSLGFAGFNTKSAATERNEGLGASVRGTYAPIMTENMVVHIGASYSTENANEGTPAFEASANYAGRRGPSLDIVTGGLGESVDVIGLEAAMSAGPVFVQAEYATATFGLDAGAEDQEVQTYYVQGAYTLTGQMKPYKASKGVFGSPAGFNVWQLTARYDVIENKDATDIEATAPTVGVNYFLNPAVRFMLNYTMGDNEADGDSTKQLALRTQLAF